MKQETFVRSEQSEVKQQAGPWTGAVMILVGVIFLMGTSGITILGYSPSMLFALVPVCAIGVAAYKCYKEEGRLTRRVFAIAVFALVPLAYIAAMVLGFSVSGLWPLGIIVVGVSFALFGTGK